MSGCAGVLVNVTDRVCTFLGAAQRPVGPKAAGSNLAGQVSRREVEACQISRRGSRAEAKAAGEGSRVAGRRLAPRDGREGKDDRTSWLKPKLPGKVSRRPNGLKLGEKTSCSTDVTLRIIGGPMERRTDRWTGRIAYGILCRECQCQCQIPTPQNPRCRRADCPPVSGHATMQRGVFLSQDAELGRGQALRLCISEDVPASSPPPLAQARSKKSRCPLK